MDDVRIHDFWVNRDREGYIAAAQKYLRLLSGDLVPKQVASRWYNLNGIMAETSGDLWIHREQDEVWWTVSSPAPPSYTIQPDKNPRDKPTNVTICWKPCEEWKDRDTQGRPLKWKGLHQKAHDFLITEGTLQELSADNANYAMALVHGASLDPWHTRPDWKKKANGSKNSQVRFGDSKQITFARMAFAALEAHGQSGRENTRINKIKNFGFLDKNALEKYIALLFEEQDGICALTDLSLALDDDDDRPEMKCSLDRIDSNGHYEPGNLQIVCKFANRWKGADDNDTFKRLIEEVRSLGTLNATRIVT